MAVEVRIPASGESIHEVQIAQWLKQPGEWVEKDEDLVEIDTDKASFQLASPARGKLAEIRKQPGEYAQVGEVIALLDEQPADAAEEHPGDGASPEDEATQPRQRGAGPERPSPRAGGDEPAERPSAAAGGDQPRVMPAARRALSEHGLRAQDVPSSGPGGRLLKEDVLRHVESREDGKQRGGAEPASAREAAERPAAAAGPERQEEVVPMSMIRRRIAQWLVEAQQTAALLTTFNEVDMSAVMDLRRRHRDEFQQEYGIKLGIMSFFIKATIEALKRFPPLNAEIRGTHIVFRNYYDIGIAVGGGKGLVVPVVRNAERLSFAEIERTIAELAHRAQANQLRPDELEGGSFTLSNGGIYGSLLSTPIVNPPQSGILGLHAIQDRPVALQGEVVIRPMMYLALTYDHRIVDGREAVTFLRHIKEIIEEPSRMLIEV